MALNDVLCGGLLRQGTRIGVAKVRLLESAQCICKASALLAQCSGRARLQSLQGQYVSCASAVKGTGLTGTHPHCPAQARNHAVSLQGGCDFYLLSSSVEIVVAVRSTRLWCLWVAACPGALGILLQALILLFAVQGSAPMSFCAWRSVPWQDCSDQHAKEREPRASEEKSSKSFGGHCSAQHPAASAAAFSSV